MIPTKPKTEKKYMPDDIAVKNFIARGDDYKKKSLASGDDPQSALAVKIPQSLHSKLKIAAAVEQRFIRDLVIDALTAYLSE